MSKKSKHRLRPSCRRKEALCLSKAMEEQFKTQGNGRAIQKQGNGRAIQNAKVRAPSLQREKKKLVFTDREKKLRLCEPASPYSG